MAETTEHQQALRERVERIAEEAGAERVAVAFDDRHTGSRWSYHGEQWFHAASTIKLAVLAGLFAAVDEGELGLEQRLHVRNRFLSAADGAPFRVDSARDANPEVHAARGRTMKLRELAHHMIVTSSNLATNLLIDLVGVERMRRVLEQMEVEGVDLRRGVEDERAFDAEINNRVTADGLVALLTAVEEGRGLSGDACAQMLDILHQQEFRSGIPAGLPDDARVAHKTGEISTVAHDAGLVYLPGRAPYALAILTGWDRDRSSGRREALAALSLAVYEHLTAREADGE